MAKGSLVFSPQVRYNCPIKSDPRATANSRGLRHRSKPVTIPNDTTNSGIYIMRNLKNNKFGKTTLYGTLIGVGGVNPPRARLRLLNGNLVNCNITERNNIQVARQLGERLYSEVGVYGTARWDLRDMSLNYFQIERITEYSRKPVDEALHALYSIAGENYDRVGDIEQLIAEIRGTDEDEF